MTVLFVEHDMHMVRHIADWVVVMAEGRIVAEGPTRDGHARPGRDRRLPRRPPGPRPRRRHRPHRRRDRRRSDDGAARRASSEAEEASIAEAVAEEAKADEEEPLTHPTSRGQDRPRRRRVDDVVAGYLPGVNILNGCSLIAHKGELIGIIGPNGAGKSTLLKAIFGHGQRPQRHGHRSNGDDITGLKSNKLVAARRRLHPAEQQRVPAPHDRREPADGALPGARRRTTSASSS